MPKWMDDAACRAFPWPELFFPGREETVSHLVKECCAECPVAAECLTYANENREYGVWGGTTEKQRDYQRRHVDRQPAKRAPTKPRPPCGTQAGRRSHSYYGEPICDACYDADAEAKRAYRKRKKNEGAA